MRGSSWPRRRRGRGTRATARIPWRRPLHPTPPTGRRTRRRACVCAARGCARSRRADPARASPQRVRVAPARGIPRSVLALDEPRAGEPVPLRQRVHRRAERARRAGPRHPLGVDLGRRGWNASHSFSCRRVGQRRPGDPDRSVPGRRVEDPGVGGEAARHHGVHRPPSRGRRRDAPGSSRPPRHPPSIPCAQRTADRAGIRRAARPAPLGWLARSRLERRVETQRRIHRVLAEERARSPAVREDRLDSAAARAESVDLCGEMRAPFPRMQRSAAAAGTALSTRTVAGCEIGVLGIGAVAAVDVPAIADAVCGAAARGAGGDGVHQVDPAVEHDRFTGTRIDGRDEQPFAPAMS